MGKWESGSGVTTVSGFTPIAKNYAPQNGKSVPKNFGYQKMTPQKMWSHHRLVPFDLLVKKPPFAFSALPSKSIRNTLLGTNSLTYPLSYQVLLSRQISLFPVWHIHLLTWRVTSFLGMFCFLVSASAIHSTNDCGGPKISWNFATSFLRCWASYGNVESLVSEERTGSNTKSDAKLKLSNELHIYNTHTFTRTVL